jgi:hypothetical protein
MFNPLEPSDYSTVYMYYNATSWNVLGLNSDVIEFFFPNLSNPSSRTTALAFTQPLTEMSIRKSF